MILRNNYYEEDEKLFSTGDEELDDILEEVYYSGIEDGYDYAQREFASVWDVEDKSDKEERGERKKRAEKRERKELKNSHRGLGRSIILGGVLPGAIGAYTTKDDTDKDYKKGYSNEDIIERAGKRGAKRGAIIGAGTGLASATGGVLLANGISDRLAPKMAEYGLQAPKFRISGMKMARNTAVAAGLGALGSYLGAKKNAKSRLQKTEKNKKKD